MGQDTVGCRSGHGHRTGQGHKLAEAFTLLGQVSVRARTENRTRTHNDRSIHIIGSGLGQGTARRRGKDTSWQEHAHRWVRSRSGHAHDHDVVRTGMSYNSDVEVFTLEAFGVTTVNFIAISRTAKRPVKYK